MDLFLPPWAQFGKDFPDINVREALELTESRSASSSSSSSSTRSSSPSQSGGSMTEAEQKENFFRERIRGHISYFPGHHPNAYPKEIVHNVCSNMSKFQEKLYRKTYIEDLNEHGSGDEKVLSNAAFTNSRKVCNFAFPNGLHGKAGLRSMEEKHFKMPSKYSAKMADLLKNLKNAKGPSFVITAYTEFSGDIIVQYMLHNGYAMYNDAENNKSDNPKPKIAYIHGEMSKSKREKVQNRVTSLYNSPKNKDGSQLAVLIGSSTLKSGLSLRRTNQIHLFEPHWNLNEQKQKKGRGIRFCSHIDLPKDQREVHVYIYQSVMNKGKGCKIACVPGIQKGSMRLSDSISQDGGGSSRSSSRSSGTGSKSNASEYDPKKHTCTIDQRMIQASNRKELVNNVYLDIIKEEAVDCMLFSGITGVNCTRGAKKMPKPDGWVDNVFYIRKKTIPTKKVEFTDKMNVSPESLEMTKEYIDGLLRGILVPGVDKKGRAGEDGDFSYIKCIDTVKLKGVRTVDEPEGTGRKRAELVSKLLDIPKMLSDMETDKSNKCKKRTAVEIIIMKEEISKNTKAVKISMPIPKKSKHAPTGAIGVGRRPKGPKYFDKSAFDTLYKKYKDFLPIINDVSTMEEVKKWEGYYNKKVETELGKKKRADNIDIYGSEEAVVEHIKKLFKERAIREYSILDGVYIEKMKVADLKAAMKKYKIPGDSKWRKPDYIEKIKNESRYISGLE
jgi:hypothetical protein